MLDLIIKLHKPNQVVLPIRVDILTLLRLLLRLSQILIQLAILIRKLVSLCGRLLARVD